MILSKEVTVYDSDSVGYDDALADIMERREDDAVTEYRAIKGKFLQHFLDEGKAVDAMTAVYGTEEEFCRGYCEGHKPTDSEVWNCASYLQAMDYQDLRELISGIDVTGIVAVADIGRWNGRVTGYKEIDGIEDVFRTQCDFARWYIDREGDLCASFSDHDGDTECVYRQWRSNVSEATQEKVLADIYNGTHKYDYRNYTKSIGSYFTDIYGITVDGREVKAECA